MSRTAKRVCSCKNAPPSRHKDIEHVRFPWPTGALWRHSDFLRLWAAQVGSAFGSRISRTVLPIIAILTIGATPTEVAILSALSFAPGMLVGLFAGGFIDRNRKRPLLIGADLVRALLIFTIPVTAWSGALSMTQLYLVAALVGAATAIFQIADNAFLPRLVGKERLVEGNAKLEATEAVAEAAGPGLAGVLVQWLTAPVAVTIDAITYLWSAALLNRIRTPEPMVTELPPRVSVLEDIAAGVRVCASHELIRPVLIADALMYLFAGFFMALYMLLALRTLELSPAVVGLIVSVGGIGSFAGAGIAQPLARSTSVGGAMVIALSLSQAANLCIALALHAPDHAVPLLVLQQLVGDAFLSAYAVHAVSLRQRVLPQEVLGRAGATFHATLGLMLPAGALLAGPLVDTIGLRPVVWIAASGGLLAAFVLAASPVRRLP